MDYLNLPKKINGEYFHLCYWLEFRPRGFYSTNRTISTLKLRASWGVIGNEKIAYFDRFSRVNSGLQAIFGSPDVSYIASTYGRLGNENLKWESTIQTDIGLEAQFFENRFSAELDYYERRTEDILVELSTPGHLGNGQGQKIRYNALLLQIKVLNLP